jgi:hypothetical protein
VSKPTKDIGLKETPYPTLVAGGPPFPAYPNDANKYGLTILDWFAGHVAAGLAANSNVLKVSPTPVVTPAAPPVGEPPVLISNEEALGIAEAAYSVAAYLVDVREQVPLIPTPVPASPPEEPPPLKPHPVPPSKPPHPPTGQETTTEIASDAPPEAQA